MDYSPYDPDREYLTLSLPDGSYYRLRLERWTQLLDDRAASLAPAYISLSRHIVRARRIFFLWPSYDKSAS